MSKEKSSRRPTFDELLKAHPSCCPSLEQILYYLPQHFSRSYSICSSPSRPGVLSICFKIHRSVDHQGNIKRGLCSNWLKTLGKYDELVFKKETSDFVLTEELIKTPLILIATGTGVSPFISFLEFKKDLITKSSTSSPHASVTLYYGCRNESKDFLFKDELVKFSESGLIHQLITSFSRDEDNLPSEKYPSGRKYVYEQLLNNQKNFLEQMFHDDAIIFVCGYALKVYN